jgi:CRP-like cAMP-binding protein
LIPLFERMSFLRTVPLFEEMPGQELRRVAEMLSDVEVAEGEVIFRKGDPGDDLFIVRRGCVALRDGATELGTAKAQEFFGELALLDNEARSADAVATEATQMLRLRSADFRELMARRPQIQERVLRAVVKRLRLATGRITRVP